MMERTSHEPPLHLRRFVAEDFATYRHWYADALLDQHLGPMDDEWLAHVLTDTEGEQWAALAGEALVAVVGLSLDPEHEAWVISDLAVDPARRGQGWGRKALQSLQALPAMQQRPNWRAYVADDTPGAQAFFDALGWQRLQAPSADDPLWTFGWRRRA